MKLAELEFPKYDKSNYDDQLEVLQHRFMTCQLGVYKTGARAVIVVEGTDASGKGGMLKRMLRLADPRGYRVYPIGAPTPEELKRHYLQRFWKKIPRAGQVAVFDRSWYGRVLVESVEGITETKSCERAYREINDFERMLTDDGVILIKLFMHISKDEQRRRFIDRLETPHKHWKITQADLQSRRYWDEYQSAYQNMLDKTSPESAPWQVIPANKKHYARIAGITYVCEQLEQYISPGSIDLLSPDVQELAEQILFKQEKS